MRKMIAVLAVVALLASGSAFARKCPKGQHYKHGIGACVPNQS